MALRRRGGYQVDEWFPQLDDLRMDVVREGDAPGHVQYPQKAIESEHRQWKALYWLRRRFVEQQAIVQSITAGPEIFFVSFSLGGSIATGQRVTPKPPCRLRGANDSRVLGAKCIFAQGNVDVVGSTRTVFDVLIQPADQNQARYSIMPPGVNSKLIVPPNTTNQTILEEPALGPTNTLLDGDFFTLDILEVGAGAANGHVLIGFIPQGIVAGP